MKTQKMEILFRSCKSDSTRKQQIVAEQTSSSSKHPEATQSAENIHGKFRVGGRVA